MGRAIDSTLLTPLSAIASHTHTHTHSKKPYKILTMGPKCTMVYPYPSTTSTLRPSFTCNLHNHRLSNDLRTYCVNLFYLVPNSQTLFITSLPLNNRIFPVDLLLLEQGPNIASILGGRMVLLLVHSFQVRYICFTSCSLSVPFGAFFCHRTVSSHINNFPA